MKKTAFITLLVALTTATSCTKRIDLDLNNEEFKRLVVEGWITDQIKAHQVRLSWTSSYFQNEQAAAASGATVQISDGTNTFPLIEQPPGSGFYYTDPSVAGSAGNTYTLNIALDGHTWTATDHMRPVADVDSIALEFYPEEDDEEAYYDILLWTVETPGVGDHYRWHALVNGESISDTLRKASFSDDQLYDGALVNGFDVYAFDADEVVSGDTVTLEQHGITQQAYDVIIAVLTETDWRGGLFDTPPANVSSNISNGGLGFFGAASVSKKSVVVP